MITMIKARIVKTINKGIMIGVIIVALSFLISLVPCIKEAGFGVCKLPNPFGNILTLNDKYYGISNNPLTGLILQFLIPFVLVILILLGSKKKGEKVVDFTKK